MKQPTRADWAEPFASAVPADGGDPFAGWHALVLPAIVQLRGVAGSSEEEFLRIGELHRGCMGTPWRSRGLPTAGGNRLRPDVGRYGVAPEQEDAGRMGISSGDDFEFGDNVALF